MLFRSGGAVFFLGDSNWFPDFYNPQYMGIMAIVNIALLLLVSKVFSAKTPEQNKVIEYIERMFIFAFLLNAVGAIGAYRLYAHGLEYDKLVHIFSPFFFTLALFRLRSDFYNTPFKKSLVVTAIIVIASGFLWEGWEAFSDIIFGTESWGVYTEHVARDTALDTIMNVTGVALAYLYIFLRKRKNRTQVI